MNKKTAQQRTLAQNNALHLWCELVADMLNEAGYEQKITIGTVDVPWTMESVKWMIKKISVALFEKPHTADLTTVELLKVQEVLNKILAEKKLPHIPFPSIEELLYDKE